MLGGEALSESELWRRGRWILLAAASVLLLLRLGGIDLWAPDEPRYGQVAEELRSFAHGPEGLVLLHLNGKPYGQKPPLYFWMAAAAGAPQGRVTEWAARIPSALAGLACVAVVAGLGRRMFGAPAALLGAALLLTEYQFAYLARRAQLDIVLTLFETLALAAFWNFDRQREGGRGSLAVMHGAMGLAVLTKGPVGLLVPLLVITSFLAWERRLRTLARACPPWAFALSIGPGLVWVAAALSLAPAGYFDREIVTNLYGRFFEGTSHARPFYYYLVNFPIDCLPWTLLWPVVFLVGRRHAVASAGDPARASAWRFLLAWIGAMLLFFSLSSGKRGLYLVPALPAVTLLCADAVLDAVRRQGGIPHVATRTLAALAGLAAAVGGGVLVTDALGRFELPSLFGVALLAIPALAVIAWRRSASASLPLPLDVPALPRFGVVLGAVFAIELAVFTLLFPALDPEKSPRPIAVAAAALTRPDEPIGLLGNRALVGGLVYYASRPVRELETPEDVAQFFAEGGSAVVAQAKQLDRIRAVSPIAEQERSRSGDRALVVVVPLRDGERSAPPPQGAP